MLLAMFLYVDGPEGGVTVEDSIGDAGNVGIYALWVRKKNLGIFGFEPKMHNLQYSPACNARVCSGD